MSIPLSPCVPENLVCMYVCMYKGSGRGGLSAPLSSVVGNALVVIDGRECDREESLPRGTRLSTEGKP